MINAFVLFSLGLGVAMALEPFDKFREGSCSGIHPMPVKASRDFIDKLRYIKAGSKYLMYRMASVMPNYSSMREDEYAYDFCLGRNTTTRDPIGATFGFGRLLSTFKITTGHGIYLEATPTDPSQSWDTLRAVVTFTDNKSFAFIAICFTGVDQRAWELVTLGPNIDERTQKMIEDHAISLGFDKSNFIWLRYDSCRYGNPIFDNKRWEPSGPISPLDFYGSWGSYH